MPSIETMLDEGLRAKEKASTRNRDCWHVSEMTNCLRGVYLQRLGSKPVHDARQLRIFEVGHLTEQLMVKHLGKYLVSTQLPIAYPELDLVGSADALVLDNLGARGVECKSQHSKSFWWMEREGANAKPEHVVQSGLYWECLRKTYPELDVSDRAPWTIVYFSKDDLCMKEVPIFRKQLEDGAAYGLSRARILVEAWRTKTPPPAEESLIFEFGKWKVNWKAKYCPVHAECTGDAGWLAKAEAEAMDRNALLPKKEKKTKK